MVRDRVQELVDFATTESPYRDANKGWVTDDVYIQWGGSSQEKTSNQGKELANVSVFWGPINQLVSIIFVVVILATILVFLAVSFAHGRFQLPSATEEQVLPDIAEIELVETFQRDQSTSLVIEDVSPIVETKVESEMTQQTIDFAAAALGGQQYKR